MGSSLLAVTFGARHPARVARFWGDMLRREPVETSTGVLLRGDGTQLGLRFGHSRRENAGPNRAHLHLTSTDDLDQQRIVETALSLGARHLDVGQRPEEGHVVLADPGDNEFCVIEPGNSFLTGCGFIGELACDGSRGVGCSGVRRWAGRLCGTTTRNQRSSRHSEERRSLGVARPQPAR